MLSKLYLPYEYLKMGLRANSYIVAAMLVLTFLLAFYYEKYLCFFFKKKIPILYATLQFLILCFNFSSDNFFKTCCTVYLLQF